MSLTSSFVRPPSFRKSSAIHVFSPGGSISDETLAPGRKYLENRGYQVNISTSVTERFNYFAGSKTSRGQELYEAIVEKPSSGVLWAARGGYGSVQLIEEGLTAASIQKVVHELATQPRWLVGYSDVTVLALRLWAKAGTLVLHGPMVTNLMDHSPGALEEMWNILETEFPLTQVFEGEIKYGKSSENSMLAEGILLGGNIQVLASMIGVRDKSGEEILPSFDGCILLLEEVGDSAYRIHRSLSALFRTNKFTNVAGIVIGQLTSANDYGKGEYGAFDVLDEILQPLGIPIITGLPIGHECETARPIVLGSHAEIHGNGHLVTKIPGV